MVEFELLIDSARPILGNWLKIFTDNLEYLLFSAVLVFPVFITWLWLIQIPLKKTPVASPHQQLEFASAVNTAAISPRGFLIIVIRISALRALHSHRLTNVPARMRLGRSENLRDRRLLQPLGS